MVGPATKGGIHTLRCSTNPFPSAVGKRDTVDCAAHLGGAGVSAMHKRNRALRGRNRSLQQRVKFRAQMESVTFAPKAFPQKLRCARNEALL